MDGEIIISDNLADVAKMQHGGYVTHALCSGGSCRFRMDEKAFTLAEGDCMIVPQQEVAFSVESSSADFAVEVIYVRGDFVQVATPPTNYGTRGHLSLFENPVMHLGDKQRQVCALNFDYLRRRLAIDTHNFHRDAMINAVQCMIIDFFDFHVELTRSQGGDLRELQVSSQNSKLMQQFLAILERGDFRQRREVGYYADALCVSVKYLSEVCKRVSGQSAIYWITRYTSLDIARQLRTTDLTAEQLADLYGFADANYFFRYVRKNLGTTPSSFRG